MVEIGRVKRVHGQDWRFALDLIGFVVVLRRGGSVWGRG